MFVIYRYLIKTIGVEKIGIWSIVLTTTMATRISELGFSGSVIKFVAQYIAKNDYNRVSEIIQTSASTLIILIGIIVLISYPLLIYILKFILTEPAWPDAFSILPYALVSLWLTCISGIFLSSLDGCLRFDLRSILLIISSTIYLISVFLLVPKHGILGLAYAQVFQGFFLLTASWLVLKKQLPFLPKFPFFWSKDCFMEILNYSFSFQLIVVLNMLLDPVTKAFLSKMGNLNYVGYYEMSNRFILQIRALIVSVNKILVPVISIFKERDLNKIEYLYLKSYNLLFYLIIPISTVLIISAPLISEIWIGYYQKTFVIFFMLLTIGWCVNSLNGPAYFANLGTGHLRWNLIGHIVIGLLNLILSYILGISFGGVGIVTAQVISLILGSLIIIFAYHLENKISIYKMIPNENLILILINMILLITCFLIYHNIKNISNWASLIIIFIYIGIILIPLWLHPLREEMILLLSNKEKL